ncbi:MAG TPA: substrate-binding domain-containing protein, partial [Acidobacteriota bacterium]|nr:substrate-binding domain-containing protein [Acidobacteriota bacterium]
FFRDLAEGMYAEARRHGFEVLVTAGEFDTLKQYNQVADFIVKRVDAIVLAPCDSRSVATAINNANRAGIPVFTVDIACLAPEAEVVSHIASDNYGGGRLAATALIEALGGSGKVAILDHPEVESVILRTRGFLEVVEEARREGRADIQLVAQLPTSGVKDRAFKVAEDILQSHPDLDAFFAINDVTALGAVAAVEKAGKQEQVKVVGFDGLPEGRQAIQDGKIYADPVQFPREIGRRAVLAVAAYLQGLEVSERVLVPTRLYRTTDSHPPEPPEDSEL